MEEVTIIDWMMTYPYLSATIILFGLVVVSAMSIEFRMGSTNKGLVNINIGKKDKKEDAKA